MITAPADRAEMEMLYDQSGEAGWTLLELLVGLVMLAIAGMLLVGALSGARRAMAGLEARGREASLEAIQTHMRHTLSRVVPIRRPGVGVDTPMLEAGRTVLHFVTSYGPVGQYGGVYLVDLELTPSARPGLWNLTEARTLYRPEPLPGMPQPARPRTVHLLLANITGVVFQYFGPRGEQQVRAWDDEWSDLTRLPDLIAVDVGLPAGDRRVWSRLIVGVPQ